MMKRKLFSRNLMVVAMVLASFNVAQAVEFKGVLGLGIEGGGDKLGTLTYADGTSVVVTANSGIVLHGGVVIVVDQYETQITVGLKKGGPSAKEGSVTWSDTPVEIMEFYRTGEMRMGMGLQYQINPKLVVDLPSQKETTKYDNALGFVAQIGWAPTDKPYPFSVDLRYTAIKYKENNTGNTNNIGGNVVGIYMNFYL